MNENNIEIVNEGIQTVVEDVMADKVRGIGTGGMVAIGIGLACVVGVGGWLVKKVVKTVKDKKALRKPDGEIIIDPDDVNGTVTE